MWLSALGGGGTVRHGREGRAASRRLDGHTALAAKKQRMNGKWGQAGRL